MSDAVSMQESLDHAVWASVLASAWTTGLLDALTRQPASASALAARTGLSLRAVEPVLDALAAHGIVEAHAGGYARRASPIAGGPLAEDGLAALVASLPDVLHGAEGLHMDGTLAERGEAYAHSVALLQAITAASARELAHALEPVDSVLDLGAGAGQWSLTMAEAYPGCRAVGVDLPEVIGRFTASAAARGLAVDTIVGDYHAVSLPTAARVILASVLHLEEEEGARALLARAAAAVRPGGTLVVVEPSDDTTPERDRRRALYAVNLMLRTQRGRAWTAAEILSWLAELGWRGRRVPLAAGYVPMEALVATRV